MKKSILFISCDEAKHICDKTQYGEASSWEKIKLNIRLSWCRITRAYTKRNRKLTQSMEQADLKVLENNERDTMRQKFQEELAKQK